MTDTHANNNSKFSIYDMSTLPADLASGLVVFLVALPLCLGIALASDAPLFSGLLAGIIGGLVVGALSGSHTSVSGPAAGLTAIVATQIANLGSFEAFLLAVVIGGVLQVILGVVKAGALSAFFPSSVIKGLLAAIGVILILKQIPHLVGHDDDPSGEMSYHQPDNETTFGELTSLITQGDFHNGAAAIGLAAVALLLLWPRVKFLSALPIPPALAAVLMGVGMHLWFQRLGGKLAIDEIHLVNIPKAGSAYDFIEFLSFPDFSQILNPQVYIAGITVAIVASLETLLNLEAVDKLDHERRHSPAEPRVVGPGGRQHRRWPDWRIAYDVGDYPQLGERQLGLQDQAVVRVPRRVADRLRGDISPIPQHDSAFGLAAILLVTGFKLASPKLFREMWSEGRYQFLPFVITVVAIVYTDLLIGVLIGLGVAVLFILNSNLRRPVRRIVETHLGGDVLHIELANQVSFLNKASLDKVFNDTKRGSNVLIDASGTDYIDPDVLSLIRDFKNNVAPAHGVTVSLRGFRTKYQLHDDIQFADYSTRELQDRVSPQQVLDILMEGNRRFREGQKLTRDYGRQVDATAGGQNPLAVVLGCIDSRVPAELIFDLGIGDIFSVRVAGNIIGTKCLGSIEYGVGVARVKLVVVLGHTRCGAVTSSVSLLAEGKNVLEATGCEHFGRGGRRSAAQY